MHEVKLICERGMGFFGGFVYLVHARLHPGEDTNAAISIDPRPGGEGGGGVPRRRREGMYDRMRSGRAGRSRCTPLACSPRR
jgi:hypothetical protein